MLGNGVASDASMTAMSLPNQNRARNKIGLFARGQTVLIDTLKIHLNANTLSTKPVGYVLITNAATVGTPEPGLRHVCRFEVVPRLMLVSACHIVWLGRSQS